MIRKYYPEFNPEIKGREGGNKEKEIKGEKMTEQILLTIKIMVPWVIVICMLSYGAVLGAALAFKDKKTDLQKLFLLCGTGIMVLMTLVTK